MLLECYESPANVVGKKSTSLRQPHRVSDTLEQSGLCESTYDGSVIRHHVDTVTFFELAQPYPLRRSQREHHRLTGAFATFQPLGLRRNRPPSERRRDVLIQRTGVHASHPVAIRSGTNAKADVLAVCSNS